ncbi:MULTISPECIES: sucrase ferredoxin [unclassified Shinella]|uniref:sucrase ferredoxin n=1 Tax=unclassified Shinella TaxID=2643062 RepID=UPI00225CA867|nr:sucrase ferredoxin [Shinella sp. YE25]CAI0335885.1 conserved hypothetical protein [Rhizobiaceae bacterium]CAK7261281.1 Sucrase ferredoxin [Shinella sp. WSC3-e]
MAARAFCRDLCMARGEPAAGLGPSAGRYALLHWPRGHWRVPRTSSHLMPEALAGAIREANAAGIHVALVDGDDIAFSHDGLVCRTATPEAAAALLRTVAEGGAWQGERDPRITVVCCTDGKQDPCCARYGFATWKALRQAADPATFRILQSTHLGGCRFAASLVVLPARARYSRLAPAEVADFLACLRDGVPYLPAYRGDPALGAAEQAAEHAVLTWAAREGLSGNVLLGDASGEAGGDGRVEYRASIAGRPVRVCLENRGFTVNTRCETIGGGTPAQVLRWVATAVHGE